MGCLPARIDATSAAQDDPEAMGVIKQRSLDDPDVRRQFPLGNGGVTRLGSHAFGRAVLEPGWRWSTHMRPLMGGVSCPVHHVQIVLAGHFAIRMDDGEEVHVGPNDVFEVPPGHDAWVVGDEAVVLLDVAGNSEAMGVPSDAERVLMSLLMTDIVNSTSLGAAMGDRAWKQVLARHNAIVRGHLDRFRGAEIKTTGDGFLATFGSALAALRCAATIRSAVREAGVEVRIGVHTGEIEITADDVGGLAVHAVARIMAAAAPSEILASAVPVAIADGTELRFVARGPHQLKGFDRPLELYALDSS
jgi:class 3 adenylate cyclase